MKKVISNFKDEQFIILAKIRNYLSLESQNGINMALAATEHVKKSSFINELSRGISILKDTFEAYLANRPESSAQDYYALRNTLISYVHKQITTNGTSSTEIPLSFVIYDGQAVIPDKDKIERAVKLLESKEGKDLANQIKKTLTVDRY